VYWIIIPYKFRLINQVIEPGDGHSFANSFTSSHHMTSCSTSVACRKVAGSSTECIDWGGV